MWKYRPSHNTLSPGQAYSRRARPIRLIFLLNALLIVCGSFVLAWMLTPGQAPSSTHALAKSIGSPQTTARAAPATPTTTIHHISPSPSPTSWLHTPLFHGNVHLPEIALTFDDGPQSSSTPQILAILQHFGIKATFFCIGQQVRNYPDLARQEQTDGDLVEDHTWSHPDLRSLAAPAISQQLSRTAREIDQVTASEPAYFRPPYGELNATILTQARRLGLSPIMWNVDPRDWSLPGSATIITRVLTTVDDGSIILLHDGGGNRAQTIAALPTIISTLQERGFRFVTVQQLLDDLA